MTLIRKLLSSQRIPLIIQRNPLRLISGDSRAHFEEKDYSLNFKNLSPEEKAIKNEILSASLNHVNQLGWTKKALRAGAEEVGRGPELSEAFTQFDLVQYFITKSNSELETHLSAEKLKLFDALKWRLDLVVPYAQKYHEALSHATLPANFPTSFQLLLQLSDSIAYHSLQDRSTDTKWYLRRIGISSIYASTELCLVQDKSQGFTTTWEFLKRRVEDFTSLNNGNLPPLESVLTGGFVTLRNILGHNAPR